MWQHIIKNQKNILSLEAFFLMTSKPLSISSNSQRSLLFNLAGPTTFSWKACFIGPTKQIKAKDC